MIRIEHPFTCKNIRIVANRPNKSPHHELQQSKSLTSRFHLPVRRSSLQNRTPQILSMRLSIHKKQRTYSNQTTKVLNAYDDGSAFTDQNFKSSMKKPAIEKSTLKPRNTMASNYCKTVSAVCPTIEQPPSRRIISAPEQKQEDDKFTPLLSMVQQLLSPRKMISPFMKMRQKLIDFNTRNHIWPHRQIPRHDMIAGWQAVAEVTPNNELVEYTKDPLRSPYRRKQAY